MSKILTGIAALTLMGAATMPVQASAAERHAGASNLQSTEMSAQHRHHWRHRAWRRPHWRHGYYRSYWGPRYGYYGYPYRHRYGYPYGYGPGVAFGIGPFGFRVF